MRRHVNESLGVLIGAAERLLASKGVDSPRLDAELLACAAIGRDRSYLYAHRDHVMNPEEQDRFKGMVRLRARRQPLAWITGEKEFFGLPLHVERGVFCPRPETELLVEMVVSQFRDLPGMPAFAEVGTGSGAIAVSIAYNLPRSVIAACDLSERALAVTRRNVLRYNLQARVVLCRAAYLTAFRDGRFDAIVSNPPYLSRTDYLEAEPEVRMEPVRALMSGRHGLAAIETILRTAPERLKGRGCPVFLELGHGQGDAVLAIGRRLGYDGSVHSDLAGLERVYKGVWHG